MVTEAIVREQEARVSKVVGQAKDLTIVSAEDYEFGCSFLTLLANRLKEADATFDPSIKAAHQAHKEAVALKSRFTAQLLEAQVVVKRKISDWRAEQERLRVAEERRLMEEARQRQEAEALAQAAELEAQGERELATLVIEEAVNAPAPVVVQQSLIPKQEGISARVNWKWRFAVGEDIGLRELVAAAATDERLLAYLCVNEKAVGAVVRAQKGLTKIPGIEVYPDETVAVRA